MLVWIGDIREADSFRLVHQLGASEFPFVAVLSPSASSSGTRNQNKVVVVLRSLGPVAPEDLVQQMVQTL